ncbi:MAG: serine/threonine-protein kinase [Aeoliella sp.]
MSASEPRTCPQCGKPLPADAPGGLCPNCVMAMNLSPETRMSTADSATAAKAPPSPEEMDERFPNFEITECLGRGGMGVVYKARQKALDREVAIKVLAGEWQDDPHFAKRFEREAKTLAQMSHPNIVIVHDFGEDDGLYYIVMEYVDGVNLRDLLTDGKMVPEQALAIVPPICEALEYAHGKGVVHRDIKPENLLLDRDGRVKIADFGIASLVGATTEVSGTLSYMAPEQLNGSVDRRADIYALGVVLYEMLTGERPEQDVVAPSKKVEVDVNIDEMVLRALEKEPERRYQTAREFCTTAECVARTSNAGKADSTQSLSSSESPIFSPWESTTALAGTLLSAAMLFPVMELPDPSRLPVVLLFLVAFSIGVVSLAGFWPFPSPFFPEPNFSSRNLPRNRVLGGKRSNEKSEHAASPWPQRVFWLLLSFVVTLPLASMAAFVGAQAAQKGIGSVEAAMWLTGATILAILALVSPVMVVVSLRRRPADAANPWPRWIVLLLCVWPAVLLGLTILGMATGYVATRSDAPAPPEELSQGLKSSQDGPEQALVEKQPAAFQGRWLWEEETGDKVWLILPAVGPASIQGTDLGGQLQFHRQSEWRVSKGKLEMTLGIDKVTGELTKDGESLRVDMTKDKRSLQFQRTKDAPPTLQTDLVILEDLALHMIVAIREKDGPKLKSLATDRIKGWSDALSVFAVELRERYRQLVGDEEFDLRATESMVKGNLGVVRCTGPKELEGKCLILSFLKTPDGWKNGLLRNSTEDVELREHLSELERQVDAAQSRKGEE